MSFGKVIVGIGLVVLLLALGTADALFVEKGITGLGQEIAEEEDSASSIATVETSQGSSGAVSSVPAQEIGVKKWNGPDVLSSLTEQLFETQQTAELTILGQVLTEGEELHSFALLKENDRAGFIAWIETPKVKEYFNTVKEALHASFSPDVRDLVDELQNQPGRAPRNFLSFLDPALSAERIIFIRIRERLFEFHIPEEKSEAMYTLIDTLTR